MESRAKILGHPIHQMLIVFPLGLLGMAVVFDLIGLITGIPQWLETSYLMIGAGVVSGVIASPFGTIDWLSIPRGSRARQVGLIHGLGNVIVLTLFTLSWILRRDSPASPPATAFLLSFLGLGLSLITAWLGGELVDRLGIGVSPGAHINASNSLSGEPASKLSNSEREVA